jgi:uncharacterized protein
MEKPVVIPCGDIRLEGLLNKNSSGKGVVVTHPHPLYGGNMGNPVVEEIARSFFEQGFTTLRFNFRGTGKSSGRFEDGIGEVDDVRAALAYLKAFGVVGVYLAGYSFGARINASVVSSGCDVQDHIMVSPPIGFMSFDEVVSMPSTGLIITGENDKIAPPDMVLSAINRWQINPQFDVLDGCDHFYTGCLNRLGHLLSDYLL